MKVDTTNQSLYPSNANQQASGDAPATPKPQPKIHSPADTTTPSGSGQKIDSTDPTGPPTADAAHATTGKEKPGKQKKPEKSDAGTSGIVDPIQATGVPASQVPPSPSVTPPNGNSLQSKVGGVVGAIPPLLPGGNTPISGQTSKPGHVQRSNRAGHLGGGAVRSAIRGVGDSGGVAQSDNKEDTLKNVLQTAKDIANGTAYGVDLKRIQDKKGLVTDYLGGPQKKGDYQVTQGTSQTPPGEQIELTTVRNVPKDSKTQTPHRPTHHAGTQSHPIGKSDVGMQMKPAQSVKQTQVETPKHAQSLQTSPQTGNTSTQTMPASHAGTQTTVPPAQDNSSPQSAGEHASAEAPNSLHKSTQPQSPPGDKATQTPPPSQNTRGTATSSPDRTAKGIQVSPDKHDGSSQRAPDQRTGETQTAAPTTSTGTAPSPSAQPVGSDASEQTDQGHTESDTPNAMKTTTATQVGESQDTHGTQTATGTPKGTQFSPQGQATGTQTLAPSVQSTGTQHTPEQVPEQTQTDVNTTSAGTQTGADTSKNSQTSIDVHTVGTQSSVSTSESGTQVKPASEDKSVQAKPPSLQTSTQTLPQTHAEPGAGAAQSTPAGDPAPEHKSATTQTMPESAAGATSLLHETPASFKENGHWIVADIAALGADINNVKKQADLGSISTVVATGVSTVSDGLALINFGGNRALALTAKSLSLLGTAIGLVPSVGQLANDVRQLIANPKDEQSKYNVANSAFELGAGLAAAAASMVFPPAALLPIIFPNLAEIGHAEILRHKKNDQYANGLKVEGDATNSDYKIAALNATPIVNWFSSTYTPELRPAIEKFEAEQGNKPGNAAAGELPVGTLHDRRVYDYYGQALTERAERLGQVGKSYLKGIADTSNLDSVTMVSRAPQVFGWPTNGQAMRVFDRSVAITYDRVHDTVHAEFFGADKDGTFRLPTRDPSLPSGKGSRNLLFSSTMLDPDAKFVNFDLPQYFADAGTVAMDIRKQPKKA